MKTHSHPSNPSPLMPTGDVPIRRRRIARRPRTAVHAGPLVLARNDAPTQLERYLDREEDRELILMHRGQPVLREIARETAVNAVRLEGFAEQTEARAAADMAIAVGAEQLEFAIDEPCLRNDAGRPIRELTAYEAKAYASDARLPIRIRAKLDAGCSALERGLRQFRIGHPAALDRERATVVFPDSPMAFGAELCEPEDPEPADARPGSNRKRLPEAAEDEGGSTVSLDLRTYEPSRRLKRRPRTTCAVGPRTPHPFPDLPEPYATYAIGSGGRSRRRIARRA